MVFGSFVPRFEKSCAYLRYIEVLEPVGLQRTLQACISLPYGLWETAAVKHEVVHPCWSRRDWVIHMAVQRILDTVVDAMPEEPPEGLNDAHRESIEDDIQRVKSQMKRQRTLFELGEYNDDLEEHKRRRRELEIQVAALEARLATAGPTSSDTFQRWNTLRNWEAAYVGAQTIREKQRVWGSLLEQVRVDASSIWIRLRDFGPEVDRDGRLFCLRRGHVVPVRTLRRKRISRRKHPQCQDCLGWLPLADAPEENKAQKPWGLTPGPLRSYNCAPLNLHTNKELLYNSKCTNSLFRKMNVQELVTLDVLLLTERVQRSIEAGESHFREFKSGWEGPPNERKPREARLIAKDIAETLVGFANADGGELFVGVEDDGTITGLQFRDETISQLLDAPRNNVHADTPLDNPVARRVKIDNKDILYFSIEKSTRRIHQTSDGRCLQRRDRETIPVSTEKLQFERQEQLSREYDRAFVDDATLLDLDLDLIREKSELIARGMSAEKCLQYFGLADYGMGTLRLRRAALLLFAKDVTKWHPRCQVRVVRVRGLELKTGVDYNAGSDELAVGNILSLLPSAWEKLRPHLVETKLDMTFKEQVMYPEGATMEALINAIAHRDYSIEGRGIEIFIYDDRMEVRSPGGLLSTVRLEDLKKLQGLHQSRNALTARVLREVGYMREMGEGMRRIYHLMRSQDLVPPELKSDPNNFSITLRHKSVFSETDQRWLNGYKDLRLTREEKLIILMGKDGNLISPQMIYDTLHLVDWDVYRTIVEQLQVKGVLYSVAKGNQLRRRAGSKKRSIPRLTIRQPEECDRALSDLFGILGGIAPASFISVAMLKQILDAIPPESPFAPHTHQQIAALLKLLGLIDENREPTTLLHGLWIAQKSRHSLATEESKEPDLNSTVYVGNLSFRATGQGLEALFGEFGKVDQVRIPLVPGSQRLKGFAFIIMAKRQEAQLAITNLHGKLFLGRPLVLSWAKPKRDGDLGRA